MVDVHTLIIYAVPVLRYSAYCNFYLFEIFKEHLVFIREHPFLAQDPQLPVGACRSPPFGTLVHNTENELEAPTFTILVNTTLIDCWHAPSCEKGNIQNPSHRLFKHTVGVQHVQQFAAHLVSPSLKVVQPLSYTSCQTSCVCSRDNKRNCYRCWSLC